MRKKVFIIWLGLELNMFGIIPFLKSKGEKTKKIIFLSNSEINVRFFYFFVQVIGRLFFAWGSIMGNWYVIRIIGLIIKIGIVPFFWWVPPLFSRLDWVSIGLIRTIQKIPGIVLFRLVFDLGLETCILISLLGFAIRRIGIKFSYKKIKKLVAWSSIRNMSILFLLIVLKKSLGIIYYCFYSVLVLIFCLSLHFSEFLCISNSFLKGNRVKGIGVTKLLLLIFSGLPPFISFLMKIYFIGGLYLFDISLIILDMDFNNRSLSFFYMLGRFLKRWKIVLLITILIIVQSIGYIKAFININVRHSSRISSLFINKYDWLFYICFTILYLMRLSVVWF